MWTTFEHCLRHPLFSSRWQGWPHRWRAISQLKRAFSAQFEATKIERKHTYVLHDVQILVRRRLIFRKYLIIDTKKTHGRPQAMTSDSASGCSCLKEQVRGHTCEVPQLCESSWCRPSVQSRWQFMHWSAQSRTLDFIVTAKASKSRLRGWKVVSSALKREVLTSIQVWTCLMRESVRLFRYWASSRNQSWSASYELRSPYFVQDACRRGRWELAETCTDVGSRSNKGNNWKPSDSSSARSGIPRSMIYSSSWNKTLLNL